MGIGDSGRIAPPTPTFSGQVQQVKPWNLGSLGATSEGIFNTYQQYKQNDANLAQTQAQTAGINLANSSAATQQQAALNDYMASHGGQSPSGVAQGFQAMNQPPAQPPSYNPPAQPQDGATGSMYAAPAQPNAPTPAPGAQSQPGNGQYPPFNGQGPLLPTQNAPQGQPTLGPGPFGHQSPADAAQALLQYTQAGQRVGAQNAQANLAKIQAEAAKTGTEAQLNEAQITALGGSDSLTSNLVQQIQSGKMKLDDLSNLGRGELANALRVGVNAKLAAAGTDTNALSNANAAAGAGQKASADLTQGGSSQEMARAAQSAYKQFDLLQNASDNFSRANNQLVNKPLNEIKATNSPEAQVFRTALSTARIEYARAASGSKSPSDTFMSEAKSALPDGITAAQIGPTLNQLRNSLAEQATGQLTPTGLGNVPPQIPGQIVRNGRIPGSTRSVPLVSNDGGNTWSPQ